MVDYQSTRRTDLKRGGMEEKSKVAPVVTIVEPEWTQELKNLQKKYCFIINYPFFLRITFLAGTQ